MTDRQLDVPRPRRRVDAFKAPGAQAQPAVPAAAPQPQDEPAGGATPKRRRATAAKKRQPATTTQMVRVHTTLSPDVVGALADHAEATNATHTEVLAAAFVEHGDGLRAGVEEAELARYEALGFRPPRNAKPPKGRMGATFYMSTKARASLDEAAAAGRFGSRSAFIDAVLRKALIDG